MTNFEKSKESLSGPVAIVAVGAEVARSDIANLFQFAAILNINLAVINILPLPVRQSANLVKPIILPGLHSGPVKFVSALV